MHTNDALSFQAPHLQLQQVNNGTATTSSPYLLKNGEDRMSRRNLSEAENSTIGGVETRKPLHQQYVSTGGGVGVSKTKTMQLQQQQQQNKQQEQQNNDNRPSGVVYKYTPATPINMTARSLLSKQFPKLANLDDDTASTSTAICGIVKDSEAYLDEW